MDMISWFYDLFKPTAKHQVVGFLGDNEDTAEAGESYLSIRIDGIWIPHVRKGLTKFYGAVYGGVEIGNEEQGKVAYNTFDAIADAKELDAAHLDRIVQGPYPLLTAVPYRGGGVGVALGLFSIKSADLAAPYLHLLKSVSKFAGSATFLPKAKSLVTLLHEGASAITGGDSLEIGRHGTFDPLNLGNYLAIRAEPGKVDVSELTYDADSRTLNRQGTPLTEYPYFVLNFTASDEREHFWDLPDLKEPFLAMKEQFRKTPKDFTENRQALSHFQVAARLSPNLLTKHAIKLAEEVEEEYSMFVKQGRLGDKEESVAAKAPREKLEEFDPFH